VLLLATARLLVVLGADLGQECVAGLLGIAQQHAGVLLEEDGVVHRRVAHAQRTLHHNHLLREPDAQDGHAGDDGVGVLLGGGVDCVVGTDDQHKVRVGEVLVMQFTI